MGHSDWQQVVLNLLRSPKSGLAVFLKITALEGRTSYLFLTVWKYCLPRPVSSTLLTQPVATSANRLWGLLH